MKLPYDITGEVRNAERNRRRWCHVCVASLIAAFLMIAFLAGAMLALLPTNLLVGALVVMAWGGFCLWKIKP